MKAKKLLTIGAILLLFAFFAKKAFASEGIIQLKSTVGAQSRCFFLSSYLSDGYHLLGTCRDLAYPPEAEVLNYILWASPQNGKEPVRVGGLGTGKIQAKISTKFVDLFVTQETSSKPKKPAGQTVMSGSVESIPFLERAETVTQPEPAPTEAEAAEEQVEEKTEEAAPEEVQAEEKTSENRILDVLKKSTWIPVIGLVGVVVFMFFLIRKG